MSLVFTDDEFIKVWNELGSPTLVAQRLGIAVRNVFTRRRTIELRHRVKLVATNSQQGITTKTKKMHETPGNIRRGIKLEKGVFVYITDGSKRGMHGKVKEIMQKDSTKKNSIIFTDDEGDFETNKEFAVVIGKTKSEIKLPQ